MVIVCRHLKSYELIATVPAVDEKGIDISEFTIYVLVKWDKLVYKHWHNIVRCAFSW
jgi:hypothetical protein